jgi:hypothetical protein
MTIEEKMEPTLVVDSKIKPIMEELIAFEPIFHHPELGTTRKAYEKMTDENFWEVGASGNRYSREYIIKELLERYSKPYKDVWETKDFHCLEISPENYLLTYTLIQDNIRITRRSTIWRRTSGDWKILYHQGTIFSAD